MKTIILPDDLKALHHLHDEIVTAHRFYLDQLQKAFRRRCEAIRSKSHQEFALISKDNKTAQKKVVEMEKNDLKNALSELKLAIHKNSEEVNKQLEAIEMKLQEMTINLDDELAAL